MRRGSLGFTMVELVVVIVLLGILSAYAVPKFAGRGGYSELTVQNNLKQSIHFAQQLAMSRTDRTITLVTTSKQIDVRENGTSINKISLPSDVSLSNANLTFDRLGSAGNNAQINIIGSVQTLNVTVEGTTGYAH